MSRFDRIALLLALSILLCTGSFADEKAATPPEPLVERFVTASFRGDLTQVKELVEEGAKLDALNKHGVTAYQAAKIRGHANVAKWLDEQGADTKRTFPEPEVYAEAYLSEITKADEPGVAVLVSQDGKILYSKGYGLANVDQEVPVTPETKFRIGSVTKQFTAVAILKLQEQGKLKVTDTLDKFIPDFPRGDEVTLHHLLTHTSGITSYTSKPDFFESVTTPIEPLELIESFKHDKFDFDPGEKWSYCNSGYFLLGHIIEKVSGTSYGEYLHEEFFEPLGMHDTGVYRADLNLEKEALGYSYEEGKVVPALNWDMSRAGAAGALYSTVSDLHRWNEGLFGGKVLKPSSLKAAFTQAKTESDDNLNGYGYGWMVAEQRGLKLIGHGGGLQGFTSYLARYPDQKLTIAVLHNAMPGTDAINPAAIAIPFGEFYLWEQMSTPTHPDVNPNVDPKTYPDFVGRYDYGGAVSAVELRENRLIAQLTGQPEYEIFPASADRFFWKIVEAEVKFLRDEDGKVTAAQHTQAGRTFKAPKLPDEEEMKLAKEVLERYAGTYDFGAVGKMVIERRDDHLTAKLATQPAIDIYPKTETVFFYKIIKAELEFVKTDDDKVEKVILRQGPVKLEGKKTS